MPVFGEATLYATVAAARARGATGTDDEVVQAISDAMVRVDRYTGDRFLPTTMTVVAEIGVDGVAVLPRRVQSVTAVRYVGATTDLVATAYRVRSADTPGDVDAVELATYGYDDLIVGAESYNGGWGSLNRVGRRIEVTGSFGWAAVPPDVARATAFLAADLTSTGTAGELIAGASSASVGDLSVSYGDTASRLATSTGNVTVDRLLHHYRRNLSLIA